MNNKPTWNLFALWLALVLALVPALRAQDKPAADQSPGDKPAVVAPAPEEKKVEPVAAEEKKVEADKPAEEVVVEKKSGETKTKLRELGIKLDQKARRRSHSNNERVSFGSDSTLAAGQQADAVVSIIGSSTSAGDVADAVVSVMGNTRVEGGTVGDAAVAVLGDNYVNGHVRGEVVAVLGNIELGPDAIVDGDLVCVGGELHRDAKAVVHGNVQNIAVAGRLGRSASGLGVWFRECLLNFRPLAIVPHLGWAWGIAFAFLVFYILLALVVPESIAKCTQTLVERPGYSLLTMVLMMLLAPVAFILLAVTMVVGIGFALIPLFAFGLFILGLFGKVVMLAAIGRGIARLFGRPALHPALGVLVGGVIVLGLYTIPFVGFIVYKVLGLVGMGVVIYTMVLTSKANRATAAEAAAAKAAAARAAAMPPMMEAMPPVAATLPPIISAVTLPRAGFWRRFAASLLDAILMGMVCGFLSSMWHGFGVFPFWFAFYCIAMWANKGTTIGGIICSLKVVRLDDQPITWTVALVRGLSAFLSLFVAGLGFMWVAFDDAKQSWHDKIAGTTIIIVPKGTPLL